MPGYNVPLENPDGSTSVVWFRFWTQPAGAVSFAQLNPKAVNGTQVFCLDAKNILDDAAAAGSIAVGGGHGSLLARVSGTWRITC